MTSILITGGTGSFGQAFTRHLLNKQDYDRIVILSRGEHAQAAMADKFDHDPRLRFFIGDVRDRDRLHRAFNSVDVVVHAAALKRIEVGHYNPNEMVKTNILGTMNVIEAAMDAGVRRVVGISSDKAWQPISPYGQSKALAEMLLLNANNTRDRVRDPSFAVVRYGNVAGSAGSVIPRWREILKNSDTVPVSDPDCTRFWMFMDEAVELVDSVAIGRHNMFSNGNDIIIPELPAYRLGDLATAMGAKMKITGLPAWEKKHEGMDFGNTSDIAPRMSVEAIQKALEHVQ